MSHPVLNLQGQGIWNQVYNEHRNATLVQTAHIPIPAFEISFLFESHILAVRCLSTTAKAHWRFAGILSQQFQIGTGGTASPLPDVTASQHKSRLNRTELIIFPKLTGNYQLIFEPAYWLKDARLTIWEYTGIESDTTEELIQTLKVDLIRIESKVDALNQ